MSGLRDSKADTDSDGIITVQELGTYLQKKVTIDSDNRQTPKTRNLSNDEGEFVFVYAENTAVIKDKSTDAKLDAVLAKLEKLESQKSSDDDIVVKKAVDGTKSWYEKYRYGGHGIGFTTVEDIYSINYLTEVNDEWGYGFIYSYIGNKSTNRFVTLEEGHSVTATILAGGVHSTYFINDDLYIQIAFGVGKTMINWEDKEQNTSGKFSLILPSVTPQISLNIHERVQPLPMRVYVNFGTTIGYYPTSYEMDNEIVKLDDWKIGIVPIIAIGFYFPRHNP